MSTLFDLPQDSDGAMPLLDDLNPEQRSAVEHSGSPLLVVAGAGSGKTRVLTGRIAHLLTKRNVPPGQIMAITFTNKAAAEMRERVDELIGRRAGGMWVSTFHSMCVRLLRREAKTLGMAPNFSIYDAEDSNRLMTLVVRDLELDQKRYPARALLRHVSALKNELMDADTAMDQASSAFERVAADAYGEYQRRLIQANAMDFDDLILQTVGLLQAFPAVAEHYRRRFRHVLVDEYQDTNHAQYTLVRELVGTEATASGVPPAELCVVGDTDQSIYAFRGATIRNIEEFERDFPNADTILLEQNYRSTQTILSAANAIISGNTGRREKRLWTKSDQGENIVGHVADNEHDEAAFVAEEIDALVDRGEARYSDVAVFYRTNNQSRVFEEIFIRLGLPYRIVGGTRFYERREIRDALAYLRVLANPEDSVSLRRIVNVPKRSIGERSQAAVVAYADQERISFSAALRAAGAGRVPTLPARSHKAIAAFVELLDELDELVESGVDIADILTAVLQRTGYRSELEESNDPQDASRLENLDELVTVAREFTDEVNAGSVTDAPEDEEEDAVLDPGLPAFLERVSLVADADSIPAPDSEGADDDAGVVTLMTVHTAKGLEYPVVFGTGWEDGVFPHLRALGEAKELAEERRLAYVAVTRARQRLYLSHALVRTTWGQPMSNPPSRFLDDVPVALVDWRQGTNTGEEGGGASRTGVWGGAAGRGAAHSGIGGRQNSRKHDGWKNTVALRLDVGDRVSHDKYGLGTVVATEGTGPRATATIDFGGAGTVRLMLIGSVPMVKL